MDDEIDRYLFGSKIVGTDRVGTQDGLIRSAEFDLYIGIAVFTGSERLEAWSPENTRTIWGSIVRSAEPSMQLSAWPQKDPSES